MLDLIYEIQAYIASQGTSIDTILALVIALVVLMSVGYLVEQHINKDND